MEEISKKDVAVIEEKTAVLVEKAESYIIENAQDVDNASGFLRKLKDMEDIIEAKRLEFTKPLNQSLKAINTTFKGLIKPLSDAKQIVTNRILNWRRAETERIAKEEEQIQASYEKTGGEVKAPIVLEKPETKIGDIQTRKTWCWEVTDFSKVPNIYKVINGTAINQAIRNGVREIEGLKIFQKEGLSIIRR